MNDLWTFQGYKAPSTGHINPEHPILEIGGQDGQGRIVIQKESTLFPEQIVLTVTAQPIQIDTRNTMVQLTQSQQTLKGTLLYGASATRAQNQAIHLIYSKGYAVWSGEKIPLQGTKGPYFSLDLPPTGIVYTKPFAYEKEAFFHQSVEFLQYSYLPFVTPPGKICPYGPRVRPYGGVCCSTINPYEWIQAYYRLSMVDYDSNTNVTVYDTSAYTQQIQAEIFPPPTAIEEISLGRALEEGHATLPVQVNQIKKIYRSTFFRHAHKSLTLHITFVPHLHHS